MFQDSIDTFLPSLKVTLHFSDFLPLPSSIAWHFVYNLLNLFKSSREIEVPVALSFSALEKRYQKLNEKNCLRSHRRHLISAFFHRGRRLKRAEVFRLITHNDSYEFWILRGGFKNILWNECKTRNNMKGNCLKIVHGNFKFTENFLNSLTWDLTKINCKWSFQA